MIVNIYSLRFFKDTKRIEQEIEECLVQKQILDGYLNGKRDIVISIKSEFKHNILESLSRNGYGYILIESTQEEPPSHERELYEIIIRDA